METTWDKIDEALQKLKEMTPEEKEDLHDRAAKEAESSNPMGLIMVGGPSHVVAGYYRERSRRFTEVVPVFDRSESGVLIFRCKTYPGGIPDQEAEAGTSYTEYLPQCA